MNTPHLFQRIALTMIAACLLGSSRLFADDAKLHDELRQLKSVYETAINSGNLDPLAPLFTSETSGVVVNNQTYANLGELKGIYDKFRADFPGVEYHVSMDAAPSLIYGDIAVARGTCNESVTVKGKSFTYTSNWTAVLRRVDGQWKLIRAQFTMDPFGSSIVDYFVTKARTTYGGGGLVIGLVVGLVLARSRRSKADRAPA